MNFKKILKTSITAGLLLLVLTGTSYARRTSAIYDRIWLNELSAKGTTIEVTDDISIESDVSIVGDLVMDGTIEGTSNGASLDIVPTAGDYLKVHSVLQVTQGLTVEGDVSVGGNYNMSFPIDLGTNPGFNTLFDSNITAAGTQSDEASVMFSIDHDPYIELHAENDGSGNLQEEYILLSKLLVISPEAVCPSFLGATPEGAVWADATNNKLKCYLGGAWNDLF